MNDQPHVGDVVLVGQSKHLRRVIAIEGSTVTLVRVDGKHDGCRIAGADTCRIVEAHPGGAR